ncbi:MAG: oligosaccharide flippase family protein [Burkholderiaceae bacterium]
MRPGSLSHALGSAMGARVGMAVLNYALFWSLSHRLGTTALGGYSLLMNVFYMSMMLPMLGLATALTRRAATERENVGVEISNAIVFAAPVTVLLAAAIFGLGEFAYGPELRAPFRLLALAMLPTASTLVSEATLMGLERVADIARFQFVEALLRAAFAVLAVRMGHGLVGVFAVFLALRVAFAVAYRFHPMLPRFERRLVSRAVQRRNWREVPVFLGIGLLAAMTGRIDIIALSRMSGLREVGVYAAASRLYDASLMLPTIAALSMMPTLARLFASDRAYFREVLVLSMRLSLGAGFVIALGVAALAQPIIDLLYRPEAAAAAPVLRWLIFGAVLMTLDQILSSTMMAAKAQAFDLRALIVALAALAAGLFALVPRFGSTGAAMAVTLAICCRVGYRLRWVVGEMQLEHLGRELGRVLAAAAAGIAALAFALPFGAAAALGACLGAYLAVLVAVGGLHPAAIASARRRLAALFGK